MGSGFGANGHHMKGWRTRLTLCVGSGGLLQGWLFLVARRVLVVQHLLIQLIPAILYDHKLLVRLIWMALNHEQLLLSGVQLDLPFLHHHDGRLLVFGLRSVVHDYILRAFVVLPFLYH